MFGSVRFLRMASGTGNNKKAGRGNRVTRSDENWSALSADEQRAVKFNQLLDVLDGCFDLLNGEISDEAWQGRLAKLANCRVASCLWWHEGLPQTVRSSSFGDLQPAPEKWVAYLEPALAAKPTTQPGLFEHSPTEGDWPNPSAIVYCMETSPVRIVFILDQALHDDAWTEQDRENIRTYMKLVAKPVRTRRRISRLQDILELTNNFLDSLPRACIVLTPDAEIISTNHLARKVLAQGDLIRERSGHVLLTDKAKQAELQRELGKVMELPKNKLDRYAWHRNLSDSGAPNSVLIAMHAFPFEDWRLESSARDRILIIVMQLDNEVAIPAIAQIREFYKLTAAQARVSVALLEGKSVEETAAALHISINTVRTHLRAIYTKLGVDSKSHLIARLSKTLTVPKGDSHAR